jgi:cysteine desulfurase
VGTLRFSFGPDTTEAEIDRILDVLPDVVERSRASTSVAAS